MELDRSARALEVFVCLAWILVFHLRLRSARLDAAGERLAADLQRAVRPIRIAAMLALVVGAALWLEGPTQPYAHALTGSSLLVAGITFAIPKRSVLKKV